MKIEKLKAPLFRGPERAGATNDWCITRTCLHDGSRRNPRVVRSMTASSVLWMSLKKLNRDYISQKDSRPTVGRFIGLTSADLSADKMPDFSSFFIGRQKINYNYLVIIFFHLPTVLGFRQSADDRPMVGRRSADDRPISRPMSYLNEPHIIGRCVGRPSADHRPTIGRSSLTTNHRPMCRPTVGRRSADCKVLSLI